MHGSTIAGDTGGEAMLRTGRTMDTASQDSGSLMKYNSVELKGQAVAVEG